MSKKSCISPSNPEYSRLLSIMNNPALVSVVYNHLDGNTEKIKTLEEFKSVIRDSHKKKVGVVKVKSTTKSTTKARKRALNEFTPDEIQELEDNIIFLAAWDGKKSRVKDIKDINLSYDYIKDLLEQYRDASNNEKQIENFNILLQKDNLNTILKSASLTLARLNIPIDVEEDADGKINNVAYADTNTIKSEDKARGNAKLQVSMLMEDKPGNLLGLEKFVNFNNTWKDLETLFKDIVTTEDNTDIFNIQMDILKKERKIKPEYGKLRRNLLNGSKQLQTQFALALDNHKTKYHNENITEVDNGRKGHTKIDLNSDNNSNGKTLSRSWEADYMLMLFEQDAKGVPSIKDKKRLERTLARYDELKKLIYKADKYTDELKDETLKLMSSVGIIIDPNAMDAYMRTSAGSRIESLKKIYSSKGMEYVFKSSRGTVNSISDLLNPKVGLVADEFNNIVTPITNESGVLNLAEVQARFELELSDNSAFGPGGKMYQTMTDYDFLTKALNNIKADGQYLSSISDDFNQFSRFKEHLKENPNELELQWHLSRRHEGRDLGVDINETSEVDEYSSRIANVMNGLMPYLTLADKKRLYYIKGLPTFDKMISSTIPNSVVIQFAKYVADDLNSMAKAYEEIFGKDKLEPNQLTKHFHYKMHNGEIILTNDMVDKGGKKVLFDETLPKGAPVGNAFSMNVLPEMRFGNEEAKGLYDSKGKPLPITPNYILELQDGEISANDGFFSVIKESLIDSLNKKIQDSTDKMLDDLVTFEEKYDKKTGEYTTILKHTSLTNELYNEYLSEYIGPKGEVNKDEIRKGLEILATNYQLNTMMANIEYTKLFTGDPRMYKTTADYNKRTPATSATGYYMRMSEDVNTHFNVAVAKNIIKPSDYINNPDAIIKYATKGIEDKEEIKRITETVKSVVEAYKNINVTDAQAWITMDRFKEILIGVGEWNYDTMEDAFNRISKPSKYGKPTSEDYKLFNEAQTTMQPRKGMHFELTKRNGRTVPVYLKYSQAVLFPGLISSSRQLTSIAEAMDKAGVSELVVEDGVKSGTINPIDLDSKDLATEFKNRSIKLRNDHWKLQQELPTKGDKDTLVGSQIRKNIIADIDVSADYGGILGNDIRDFVHKMDAELSNRGFNKVKKKLGIDSNGRITDTKPLYDYLIKELEKEGGSIHVIRALKKGAPIDAILSHRHKLMSKITSFFNKHGVKLKQHGGSAIQMSNYGFDTYQEDAVKYSELRDKDKKGITWLTDDRTIKPMRVEEVLNPETNEIEVKYFSGEVLLPYKQIAKLFGEEEWDRVKRLPANEIMELIDDDALDLIGYRIPNQKLSSSGSLKVVGILPPQAGDTIISYSEITSQTGSDFDIDKMFFFFPSITRKKNRIVKVQYLNDSNSTVLDRTKAMFKDPNSIENLLSLVTDTETKNSILNAFIDISEKIDSSIEEKKSLLSGEDLDMEEINMTLQAIKDIKSKPKKNGNDKLELFELYAGLNQLIYDEIGQELGFYLDKKEAMFQKVSEHLEGLPMEQQNTTSALQSRRVDLYKNILESNSAFLRSITQVDSDWLRDNIRMTSPETNVSGLDMFSGEHQMKLRREFISSQGGVGQTANHLSDHAISQGSGKYIVDSNLRLDVAKDGKIMLDKTYSDNFETIEETANGYKVVDNNKHYYISEAISAYMNAFVDAAKDNYIGDANFNSMTNNTAFFLIRAGYSPQFVNAFISQPYIKKYVELSQKKEGQAVPSSIKSPQELILEELGFESLDLESELSTSKYKTTKLMKNISSFDGTLESVNPKEQLELFSLFIYTQNLSKSLAKSMTSSKADVIGAGTSLTSAIIFSNMKRNVNNEIDHEGNQIVGNFDNTFEQVDSEGNEFKTLVGASYDNSVEAVISAIGPLSIEGTEGMQSIVNRAYVSLYGKLPDDEKKSRKLFQLAYAAIVSNKLPLFNVGVTNEEGNGIADLMKGKNSVAKRLRKMKKNHKYNRNALVHMFTPKIGIYGGLDYVGINNSKGRNEVVDERLTYDWLDLFYSGDSNDKKFATDMVIYAFYTSALSDNLSSIYRLIPPEIIHDLGFNENMFNEIRNSLGDRNEGYERDIINEILRNSWHDTSIVPKVYYNRTRGIKIGKSLSNNNFVFEITKDENPNLVIGYSEENEPVFKPYLIKDIPRKGADGRNLTYQKGKNKGRVISDPQLFKYIGNREVEEKGEMTTTAVYRRVNKLGESKGVNKLFEFTQGKAKLSIIKGNNMAKAVEENVDNWHAAIKALPEFNYPGLAYTKGEQIITKQEEKIEKKDVSLDEGFESVVPDVESAPTIESQLDMFNAFDFDEDPTEAIEKAKENKDKCNGGGSSKAEKGAQFGFTPGSRWKIIKDFKGKSHDQGGIDINISKNGIKMSRKNGNFEAKNGVVINGNGMDNPEYNAMSKVISQRNSNIPWVQRGLAPNDYPKYKNEDGSESSHVLSAEVDDKGDWYVFPTLEREGDKWIDMRTEDYPQEAFDYAKKNKSAIKMPSKEMALYYSRNGLIKH